MTDEELGAALAAALGHYPDIENVWTSGYGRTPTTYTCATCRREEFPCEASRKIAEKQVPVVHRYVVELIRQ